MSAGNAYEKFKHNFLNKKAVDCKIGGVVSGVPQISKFD